MINLTQCFDSIHSLAVFVFFCYGSDDSLRIPAVFVQSRPYEACNSDVTVKSSYRFFWLSSATVFTLTLRLDRSRFLTYLIATTQKFDFCDFSPRQRSYGFWSERKESSENYYRGLNSSPWCRAGKLVFIYEYISLRQKLDEIRFDEKREINKAKKVTIIYISLPNFSLIDSESCELGLMFTILVLPNCLSSTV